MRAHAVKHYESVIQVLNEPGCPICTFVKNVQSRLLQEGEVGGFTGICNTHAWALAAVRRSAAAAQIFLSLIEQKLKPEQHECAVCIRLDQEETLRIQELLASFKRRHVVEWTEKRGVFCLPHGLKLREEAAEHERGMIEAAIRRTGADLEAGLREFVRDQTDGGETTHGGVLGKAAEYLVGQRGICLRLEMPRGAAAGNTMSTAQTR